MEDVMGSRLLRAHEVAEMMGLSRKHVYRMATERKLPSVKFEGTFRDPSHVVRDFRTVLKKAGLRRIRFHDLRHTYTSLLLQNRESPVYVKEQLGHHSIQITVDTYGHLVPGANREAVNRLDDLLEKPAEPAPQAHPPLLVEASTSSPSPANA